MMFVNVGVPPPPPVVETESFAVPLTPLTDAVIVGVPFATPIAVPAFASPEVATVA